MNRHEVIIMIHNKGFELINNYILEKEPNILVEDLNALMQLMTQLPQLWSQAFTTAKDYYMIKYHIVTIKNKENKFIKYI